MQIIRDLLSTQQIRDPAIRKLVQQRIKLIASDEPYDANLHGYFAVTSEEVRVAFRNYFSDATDFIRLLEDGCAKLTEPRQVKKSPAS